MILVAATVIVLCCCSGIQGAVDSNLCITAHNKLRALHQNTGGLVWSQDLANKAQRWAEENLRNNRMKHEQIEGQGENIYYGNNLLEADCTDAALAWYSEIKDYDYGTADTKNGKAVGHFTQLVWKDTTQVGVGIASKKSGSNIVTFIVAKYTPLGNFHMYGQRYQDYSSNVQPRKSGAKTPAPHEIDSSRCKNSDENCGWFLNNGYTCSDSYIASNCYESCVDC